MSAMIFEAQPDMPADRILTAQVSQLRSMVIWGSFLAPFGGAVAMGIRVLFLLILITPMLILFYLVFG